MAWKRDMGKRETIRPQIWYWAGPLGETPITWTGISAQYRGSTKRQVLMYTKNVKSTKIAIKLAHCPTWPATRQFPGQAISHYDHGVSPTWAKVVSWIALKLSITNVLVPDKMSLIESFNILYCLLDFRCFYKCLYCFHSRVFPLFLSLWIVIKSHKFGILIQEGEILSSACPGNNWLFTKKRPNHNVFSNCLSLSLFSLSLSPAKNVQTHAHNNTVVQKKRATGGSIYGRLNKSIQIKEKRTTEIE